MRKTINVMNLVVATMIFMWMESQDFFVHFLDVPYMYGQVELLYLIILNLVLLNVFELSPKISLVCSVLIMLLFPFTGGRFRVDGCSYYLVVEKIIWNISNHNHLSCFNNVILELLNIIARTIPGKPAPVPKSHIDLLLKSYDFTIHNES